MSIDQEQMVSAVESNDLESLKKIINRNKIREQLDFNDQELLFTACMEENVEIVEYLSQFEEIKLNDSDNIILSFCVDQINKTDILVLMLENLKPNISYTLTQRLINRAIKKNNLQVAYELFKYTDHKDLYAKNNQENFERNSGAFSLALAAS